MLSKVLGSEVVLTGICAAPTVCRFAVLLTAVVITLIYAPAVVVPVVILVPIIVCVPPIIVASSVVIISAVVRCPEDSHPRVDSRSRFATVVIIPITVFCVSALVVIPVVLLIV